jgi:uncharacterized protein with FMN-binding domain
MNRAAKKIILSVLVIAAFAGYTLAIRGHIGASKKSLGNASQSATAGTSSDGRNSSDNNSGSEPTGEVNSSGMGMMSSGKYNNGTFTGSTADAFYGNVQIQAIISGGKITDIQFLQSPNDNPNSININQQAMPLLKQEALQAQSASVDLVTGATETSQAFKQSLASALMHAKA